MRPASGSSASVWSRIAGAISAVVFGAVANGTNLLPPKWRYAYIHPITRTMLPRNLPRLDAERTESRNGSSPPVRRAQPGDVVCAIVADKLDVGGIGSVIELLSVGLPDHGVHPVIVCQGDGPRADRLRARGLTVISVPDGTTTIDAIERAKADVVQVHSAPPLLEQAALASGLPVIAVLHNTEIHYTRAQWERFGALLNRSEHAIAVSRVVRDFHARHSAADAAERFVVIPNGARSVRAATVAERDGARGRLGTLIGRDLADAVVFCCLARYDAQKNIAGMVAAFLDAAARSPQPIHLVVAGEPSDWVELRRADGIRRRSRSAESVHLLANSDAGELLAASDAFLLDSFFEGWPVAATEALAAGLPLVLSDVGGASELIARDPGRSVLVPNAVGAADAVTDERVRRARRMPTRQRNRAAVADAILRVAQATASSRYSPRHPATVGGLDEMVAAHAEIIRATALRR